MHKYHSFQNSGDPHFTHVGFGIRDKKGRELGSRLCMRIGEVVEKESDCVYSTCLDPYPVGTAMVAARFEATRAGAAFGASQDWRYFRTAAEARAAFEAYLVGARKRAAKNAA